jgi:hypothetical protein
MSVTTRHFDSTYLTLDSSPSLSTPLSRQLAVRGLGLATISALVAAAIADVIAASVAPTVVAPPPRCYASAGDATTMAATTSARVRDMLVPPPTSYASVSASLQLGRDTAEANETRRPASRRRQILLDILGSTLSR